MSVGRPRPCQPAIAAFVVIAIAAYACGGGGGTGTATTTTGGSTTTTGTTGTTGTTTTGGTTSNIQVTVDPQNTTCYTSAQVQFTAVLTGTTNQAVTWSVDGLNRGTVDQNGLFTAVDVPTNAFVRATSVADPAKSGVGGVVIKNRAKIEFFGSPTGTEGLPIVEVNDMSFDGLTAVGRRKVGQTWFPAYWTKLTGWVQLTLPPGTSSGTVMATAGNANWMVGFADGLVTRFSKSGITELILDDTGTPITAALVDCSAPGNVIVGGNFRWREGIGFDVIAAIDVIYAISSNGFVIGGAKRYLVNGQFFDRAVTWTDSGGIVDLQVGDGSRVLSLSQSGSVSAGSAATGFAQNQFYRLGAPQFNLSTVHRSLSGNGTWVTGTEFLPDHSAFRWSNATGKMYIKDLLVTNGLLTDLGTNVFDGKTWVSDDGRKFMGEYGPPGSTVRKYYFATLP